mmetsp:Transcript_14621/g.31786  ORF Transcript_14621/g.31786 Transcript_14621/m.31786 type:complete len:933 (+) Transcript_14621:33-2831(+)
MACHHYYHEQCLSPREHEERSLECSESSSMPYEDGEPHRYAEAPAAATSTEIIPLSSAETPLHSSTMSSSSSNSSNNFPYNQCTKKNDSRRFVAKMALSSTACTVVFLFLLTVSFSELNLNDILGSSYTSLAAQNNGQESSYPAEGDEFSHVHRRHLDENNENKDNADSVDDGDYSAFRCEEIFANTPSPNDEDKKNDKSSSSSKSNPTKRCQYAKTCEGDGILMPFLFCTPTFLTSFQWLIVLSPILLLALTLLFRLLGSTAEEYFSPSLEMFSFKLGLPPRFAGVSLLALGNGAADVSATMNAISSDPENGYKMSLGALTGAAMFITTAVAGSVILANGGMTCRGALVRDVVALGVAVVIVALNLEKGVVGPNTEHLFITIYVLFVLIVLVADVYHRAVMLPRIQKETEMREHQRQLEAERVASLRAGDALNGLAPAGSVASSSASFSSAGGHVDGGAGITPPGTPGIDDVAINRVGSSASDVFGGSGSPIGLCGAIDFDDQTNASAPTIMEDAACHPGRVSKNRALNAVLTALSNYNDDEHDKVDRVEVDDDGNITMGRANRFRNEGWGIDNTIEGSKSWDRPVMLHGADGILSRHHHRHPQTQTDGIGIENEDHFQSSPYHVMEDMDLTERSCVQEGSVGYPAYDWMSAWHDSRHELAMHFREYWRDIVDNDEIGRVEKFLLICEFPMTVFRKLTVSIPCEGSYCRALVALSLALSPLWLVVYCYSNFGINIWGWKMGFFVACASVGAMLIMRYAPGGDGTMATLLAVPLALWGFVVAATWIDWIADKLVALLGFLGVVLRVPNYIMGLTVLAWGNSMADLSANVTMARKGLANMAITACFAGPLFNILVGLGAGFRVLRSVTHEEFHYVSLTPAITTGFVFCFINCGLLLVSGLVINKGVIPVGYGYAALALYFVYIIMSLLLQFLL